MDRINCDEVVSVNMYLLSSSRLFINTISLKPKAGVKESFQTIKDERTKYESFTTTTFKASLVVIVVVVPLYTAIYVIYTVVWIIIKICRRKSVNPKVKIPS